MKLNFKSLAAAAVLAISAVSAGAVTITPSKNYITRKVTSGAFDAVRTNTAIDIIYSVGARDIEIVAPDNLMPYVQVALAGTEIRVSYSEDMNIKGQHHTYVKISAPEVTRFTAASAGDITIKNPLVHKTKTIELIVLSAGDIKSLGIEAEAVRLRTNSAGDIKTGTLKAETVKLIANSAGDIETGAIAAKQVAELVTNSAGDIDVPEVVAGKSVSIAANSAGDVEAKVVSAPEVTINTNSAGDIEVDNLKATDVVASTSSAGDIKVVGSCSKAKLHSGSSGSVYASKLKANEVTATVRSSGDVKCHALETLSAYRSGMGEIFYKGNPANLTISDSRSDGVKPM